MRRMGQDFLATTASDGIAPLPLRIVRPAEQLQSIVVASPHSGADYPASFLAASRLDPHALRRSEDCFVDRLLDGAAELGIPVLAATFPRAYCDANREPWELDQSMFSDKLPPWCNTRSARITAGFGTIARLVGSGQPIYSGKLAFADAEDRIRTCWQPYHDALSSLVGDAMAGFGRCILLDVHSMPTEPSRAGVTGGEPDFVLGDAHGTSCHPLLSISVQRFLEACGFRVRRNDPYAGAYTTRHYGRPRTGVHALQIEISRALYMDQSSYRPLSGFDRIRDTLSGLLAHLLDEDPLGAV